MNLYVQIADPSDAYSGAPPAVPSGTEMRGKHLSVGYGLTLYEDDEGLPGLQVMREKLNPIIAIPMQFGDGESGPPPLDSVMIVPMAFSGTFENWRIRLEQSGDVTFEVSYASTISGPFVPVGGTNPAVTNALANEDLNGLNWTIADFVPGGVLRVQMIDLQTAWVATITLGVRRS
jgi:hypothetical protein